MCSLAFALICMAKRVRFFMVSFWAYFNGLAFVIGFFFGEGAHACTH